MTGQDNALNHSSLHESVRQVVQMQEVHGKMLVRLVEALASPGPDDGALVQTLRDISGALGRQNKNVLALEKQIASLPQTIASALEAELRRVLAE